MYTAYAIVNVIPVVVLALVLIGIVCYFVGQYRATYLWNQADLAHDDIDTSKYYVHMLFSETEVLEEKQQQNAGEVVPSLEELVDMAHDLAAVADDEYQQWIDSVEANLAGQEREERRTRTLLGHGKISFTTIQWAV